MNLHYELQPPKPEEKIMSPVQARESAIQTATSRPVDMKLEVVVIPVSDFDRAKQFYSLRLGRSRMFVESIRSSGRSLNVNDFSLVTKSSAGLTRVVAREGDRALARAGTGGRKQVVRGDGPQHRKRDNEARCMIGCRSCSHLTPGHSGWESRALRPMS
jgi:hypothetical protein